MKKRVSTANWFCYLISSSSPKNLTRTYFGVTNNLLRRIRQHNGEIVGGAKCTSSRGPWSYICVLSGFPTQKSALQFEWRIHHPIKKGRRGIKGRLNNIKDALKLEKWKSMREPVLPTNMKVIWFNEEYECILHDDLNVERYESLEKYLNFQLENKVIEID
jgi:predicted GIY-YIG superfamily endonuclease